MCSAKPGSREALSDARPSEALDRGVPELVHGSDGPLLTPCSEEHDPNDAPESARDEREDEMKGVVDIRPGDEDRLEV
jgi:hypothetical protein